MIAPVSEVPVLDTSDTRHEDEADVFLGETTSLRYVPDDLTSPTPAGGSPRKSLQLRHVVPNNAKADALLPSWETERRRIRIDFLQSDGAFSVPPGPQAEGLLKAYFRWFHPCFAIVDEVDIWNQFRGGTLSTLLLQAMLFVGVLHCDENMLRELELDNRHRAKYIFYNRAKDIYDAEFERRKLTVIQALFLMSFMRAGALLEKDTRHWLGCAITLAQTKALHRSAVEADTHMARLRKRIWWSLYTRDRQCAAALGLPNRIRDEDCDFEPLEVSDFDHAFNLRVVSREEAAQYASYAVAMTELAQLLGKVVHYGYLPGQTLSLTHRAQVRDELESWKQRLPSAMQPDSDASQQPGFYANMQHLAYNNLLILLYRQAYIGREPDRNEADGNLVLQAAARNSRLIEDMLSDGSLCHAQIHVITNLFNTLCIHTVHLRRSEGTARTVAEHRAKLCLLGLQELQKTWEVTNWLLQLFFQYLDHSTAARLVNQQDAHLAGVGAPTAAGAAASATDETLQPTTLNENHTEGHQPLITFPELENLSSSVVDLASSGSTPWPWTNAQTDEFLFSQIEHTFAFGEGSMLDWTPEENPPSFYGRDMDGNFMQ